MKLLRNIHIRLYPLNYKKTRDLGPEGLMKALNCKTICSILHSMCCVGVLLFSQIFPTLKFWAIQWRAWQLVFISSLGGQGTISLESSTELSSQILKCGWEPEGDWILYNGFVYFGFTLVCSANVHDSIIFVLIEALHVHFCCKVKAVGAWTQPNHSFLLSKKNALCLRERIALPWCRLERLVAHFTRL